MKLHRENRFGLKGFGFATALLLTGLLQGCAGESDQNTTESVQPSASQSTTGASPTTTLSATSPDPDEIRFAPLNCAQLLTQEERDEATAIWDREGNQGSWFYQNGEVCREELAADENVFVQIGPGHRDDFQGGAELEGMTAVPVSGIGDDARWFSGDTAGTLSVTRQTPLGSLYYRISLGRPDLDDAGRLELAKTMALSALPRFPGVQSPPLPPPLTIAPPELVDTSNQGYAENLLEKEADGEWTRGEGLVATLGLLVGEADPSEVLRHPDLLDFGTDVIRMARQYLEDGDDPAVRSEIERLLAVLLQHPTESEMVGVSPPIVGGDPTGRSQITGVLAVHSGQPVRSETVATADRLMTSILAQEGEEECRPYLQEGNCWAWVDIEPEKYGEGTYRLMGPQFSGDHGWRGSHVNLLERAMINTIGELDELGIRPPHVLLIMTPHPELGSADAGPDWCVASVNTGFQQIAAGREEQAEQLAAMLIANCTLHSTNFPDGSFAHDGWTGAGAMFLSDVVYPNGQLEQLMAWPGFLEVLETSKSMLDYHNVNWAFLEDVGIGTALELLRSSAGGLGGFPGIDDLIHQYARNLTAGRIADQGSPHGYNPPRRTVSLSSSGINGEVSAFRPLRIEVSVDGGDHACVSFPNADYVASWSPGSVGNATAWSSELPETMSGNAVFIVTFTADTEFVLKVSKFVEDPEDCEDDEDEILDESPDALPPPCPKVCKGTDYFPPDE